MSENLQQYESYIQVAAPFMDEEELQALKEPIQTGWLTQGPKVAAFEREFARIHEVPYALATTSCTTGLHLALLAVGIGPGDKVIVPSFTWIATANTVEYCGGIPIFCDNDLYTYNINPNCLEQIIRRHADAGQRIKALIAVHLFGLCADMDPILEIARRYDLAIIEDAACAVGADYKGQMAGSIGNVGCFSFHPRKIVTTGEGGMCTTKDQEIAKRIACLRSHGASLSEEQRHSGNKPYLMADFEVLGFNYRMTDFQGAIGLVQLGRLNGFLKERTQWAAYYYQELKELSWLQLPVIPEGVKHSWQAFVCRLREYPNGMHRDEILDYLHKRGIGGRAGTHAIHELGYYKSKYGLTSAEFPEAAELYDTTFALPLHNRMTAEDYARVVEVLKEI